MADREYILKNYIPARDRFEKYIIRKSKRQDSQFQKSRLIGGIIDGIVADKVLKASELDLLFRWLSKYKDNWPKCNLSKAYIKNVSVFAKNKEDFEGLRAIANEIQIFKTSLYQNEELIGLIKGFLSDGELNTSEIDFLTDWLTKQDKRWPITEIQDAIRKWKTEGSNESLGLLVEFLDGITSSIKPTETHTTTTHSFISNPPKEAFEIKDKPFELSGCFEAGSKSFIAKEIEDRGGVVTSWYSDGYLVVGKYSDPRWIHGIYGRKIEFALENKIPIISESYLIEAFDRIPRLPPKPPKPPKQKKELTEPLKPEEWRGLAKRAEKLRDCGEISNEVCNEILQMISTCSGLTDIKYEEVKDDSIQIKTTTDGGLGLCITVNNELLERKRAEWQKYLNPENINSQSYTNPQQNP
jgi:hypothetical protein